MSRTVAQKTNANGFPKPAEVIEITGGYALEAMDRAALDLLYRHAHDSGRLAEPNADFEIEMARLRSPKHKGNERVRDALRRLMRVEVNVSYTEPGTGEDRILVTHLFDFFDLSANEAAPAATVRFGLPRKLQPIIARSGRWGRIKAEVVCAMTSKYAIALYELVQLRANLERCTETFPIDRFRELMGVPPGKLLRGNDFERRVLDTAVIEINGLSDVGVAVEAVRQSPRAPITAVSVAWWRKEGDAYRETLRELGRPKVGRMARLKGTVEQVDPPPPAIAAAVVDQATPERPQGEEAPPLPDWHDLDQAMEALRQLKAAVEAGILPPIKFVTVPRGASDEEHLEAIARLQDEVRKP